MKRISKSQSSKTKFRSTSRWKKFRQYCKKRDKVDYITQKPLLKGFNLHHLNLNETHYQDLSDETKFVCLNKSTHEMVHWLYRYYQNDQTIIDRLEEILKQMFQINKK